MSAYLHVLLIVSPDESGCLSERSPALPLPPRPFVLVEVRFIIGIFVGPAERDDGTAVHGGLRRRAQHRHLLVDLEAALVVADLRPVRPAPEYGPVAVRVVSVQHGLQVRVLVRHLGTREELGEPALPTLGARRVHQRVHLHVAGGAGHVHGPAAAVREHEVHGLLLVEQHLPVARHVALLVLVHHLVLAGDLVVHAGPLPHGRDERLVHHRHHPSDRELGISRHHGGRLDEEGGFRN
jgi:hypothetical protein